MREVPIIGFVVLIGAVAASVIMVRLGTVLIKRLEHALLAQNQIGRVLPAGERQP